MSLRNLLICIILLIVFAFGDYLFTNETEHPAPQTVTGSDFPNEQILSETENAYNPIPSPDGKMIAYVETGWNRNIHITGLGRSNLQSNIKLMDSNGKLLTDRPLADAFLDGWTSDGNNLIAFRDWAYLILSVEKKAAKEKIVPPNPFVGESSDRRAESSERFAYLEKEHAFVWIQNEYKLHPNKEPGSYYTTSISSTIRTTQNDSLPYKGFIPADNMLIPSPNGRYIAMLGKEPKGENNVLQIYDRNNKTWTNLGKCNVHPDNDWDFIQPSWNPWFADSTKLVFVSPDGIVVSSPDGKNKKTILNGSGNIGIPAASPDGNNIAYISFEPRPKRVRPDLMFYGGTTIRVIDSEGKTEPRVVTKKNEDETYCVRWLNNRQIVFDRVADESYFKKARLWKADVFAQTR